MECVIEIPKNSHLKYEINDDGHLCLDRVLPKGFVFPGNYGYIPNTLACDSDPLDVLVLTEYPIQSLCRVKCRAVAVLIMKDEKGLDEKILAVPTSAVDMTYDQIRNIEDIPERTLKEVELFFRMYKKLDSEKWTEVTGFEDAEFARTLVEKYARAHNNMK